MKVKTTRFGVLEIDDSSVVQMPKGLIGFESEKQFCLIQHRPDTKFRWLQSVKSPGLAFVVVDPTDFYVGYEIEITDSDAKKLHLTSEEDAIVLAIVSIAEGGKEITANLAAPVVVNSKELLGAQVVLQDERYSVRHELITTSKEAAEEKVTAKAA